MGGSASGLDGKELAGESDGRCRVEILSFERDFWLGMRAELRWLRVRI